MDNCPYKPIDNQNVTAILDIGDCPCTNDTQLDTKYKYKDKYKDKDNYYTTTNTILNNNSNNTNTTTTISQFFFLGIINLFDNLKCLSDYLSYMFFIAICHIYKTL